MDDNSYDVDKQEFVEVDNSPKEAQIIIKNTSPAGKEEKAALALHTSASLESTLLTMRGEEGLLHHLNISKNSSEEIVSRAEVMSKSITGSGTGPSGIVFLGASTVKSDTVTEKSKDRKSSSVTTDQPLSASTKMI